MFKCCKDNKLHSFEIPKKILITYEQFTIENKMLTTTIKLKRDEIKNYWGAQLSSLYINN